MDDKNIDEGECMSNKKNRYQITIGNRNLTIVSNKSSEHMDKVSSRVKKDLRDIDRGHGAFSLESAALLAAFNEASDYIDQKEVNDQLQDENRELQARLDEVENENQQLSQENERLSQSRAEGEEKPAKTASSSSAGSSRRKKTSSKKDTSSTSSTSKQEEPDPFKQDQKGLSKTPRK